MTERTWPLAEITDHLDQVAGLESGSRAFARFVLDHGIEWGSQPLPDCYEGGIPRRCFGNCQDILFSRQGRAEGLVYVEGYACSGLLSFAFPTLHAWLVDPDGSVVDPTWEDPDTSTYFGVPFTPEYVRRATRESHLGISLIDNFDDRWKLLRTPGMTEEAVLRLDTSPLRMAR
jgi:hypothetical protein